MLTRLAFTFLAVAHGTSAARLQPKCDLSRAQRAKIELLALDDLHQKGFKLIEGGAMAYMIPKSGEQVAGNPNTLYGVAGFNDTGRNRLIPADYPQVPMPGHDESDDDNPQDYHGDPKPPALPALDGLKGSAYQRNEAVVIFMCTPPPAEYFGVTAYIFNRLLINDTMKGHGDGDVVSHTSVVEIGTPINYIFGNVTAGPSDEERKIDPRPFFESATLMVFSPSREVYEEVAKSFVRAGLPKHATNFYPLPAQSVRLHDRSKPVDYDYPDLVSVLSRVSYFHDEEAGLVWAQHPWPALFVQAPDLPKYMHSVPAQLFVEDRTGDSERRLVPTMEKLMDAIVKKKTEDGRAKLLRKEQLVPIPNDEATQQQCLSNLTFIPAVDPVMVKGGCGFGTRDCRYGTSPAMDTLFKLDRFFVLVGVKHEMLKHSSYSSVMFTSQQHYEERNHTITVREEDGSLGPEQYMSHASDVQDMDQLFAITFARKCPEDDACCFAFTEYQFSPKDIVYWMERAYLQRSTGVAPNIEEYVMSYVLTFEGEP